MKKKRILSTALALLLVASLSVTAFAEEYDLAIGSIEVTASDGGSQHVTQMNGVTNEPQTTATVITQTNNTTPTNNTITITAEKNQTAEVTLSGVNIDTSDTGKAAVSTEGKGDVTIELDGENAVKSAHDRAGLEKKNDGSLTITDADNDGGSLTAQGGHRAAGVGGGFVQDGSNMRFSGGKIKATGGSGGAGVGGGMSGKSSSNITIDGNAQLTARGGDGGAGIGGGGSHGAERSITNITVSDSAHVKVQGGPQRKNIEGSIGKGAGIGGGGWVEIVLSRDGGEVKPDVSRLTPEGKIEYYEPGADMEKDAPIEDETIIGTYVPETEPEIKPEPEIEPEHEFNPEHDGIEADTQSVRIYWVTDKDDKYIPFKAKQTGGVLTITADVDFATLSVRLSGVSTLRAQGVEKIVFITNGATSTRTLSALLSQGNSGIYRLTHDGRKAASAAG